MFVPSHVNETTEPVDNLGGILSVVLVAALVLAINFAPVPDQGALALGLAAIARRRRGRVLPPAAARAEPAVRPARRRPPHVLGRGLRRLHRVRLADGRDVHRPAVPAERPRLLDPRGRRRDPAGRPAAWSSSRRARPSSSRRRAPGSRCSSATSSACSASSTMLLLWDDGHPYWAVGARLRARRHRCRASPARRRRTRSPARCPSSGPGWPRAPPTSNATSAARSCSRSSARCSPPGTRRRSAPRSPRRRTPRQITDSVQTQLKKSFASAEEIAEQYPQYADADHRRRPVVVPRRRRLGLHGRDRRDPARRGVVFFLFPRRDEEKRLLAEYHDEDTAAAPEQAALDGA